MLELKKKRNQEGKEMLCLGSQQKMCFGHHRHVFYFKHLKNMLKIIFASNSEDIKIRYLHFTFSLKLQNLSSIMYEA